jgi:hypothetical protein
MSGPEPFPSQSRCVGSVVPALKRLKRGQVASSSIHQLCHQDLANHVLVVALLETSCKLGSVLTAI